MALECANRSWREDSTPPALLALRVREHHHNHCVIRTHASKGGRQTSGHTTTCVMSINTMWGLTLNAVLPHWTPLALTERRAQEPHALAR